MNEASYARTMPNSVFPLLASMVLVLAQTSLVGCAPGASRAQVARSPESLTPHALDRADAKLPSKICSSRFRPILGAPTWPCGWW